MYISAVNALVTSRLDNCNSLLHNITLSETARWQRVENNVARLITNTSKHDHVRPVLKELHWLPVESRTPTPELCANTAPRHNTEVHWRFGIWRYSTTTVE
ncbi:hypothetical protein NP493_848g03068 [Ridgeia piscesae]|uniref:Uncharacterized protein n=1 Tax=Ridgeia piscesae TaxID=27915 RepID=A0AAD9KNB0_RIDPI|nr:hypothetical protein NP493_848g03068 [Ridgeia piscesae]